MNESIAKEKFFFGDIELNCETTTKINPWYNGDTMIEADDFVSRIIFFPPQARANINLPYIKDDSNHCLLLIKKYRIEKHSVFLM